MGEAEKRAAHAAYMRKWSAMNREKVRAFGRASYWHAREKRKAAVRAYNNANRGKVFLARIKRIYGLTPELHAHFVARAGGRCEVCKAEVKLVIDHDHNTGRVRGLVCNTCNLRLGKAFKDGWDKKAEAYIARTA